MALPRLSISLFLLLALPAFSAAVAPQVPGESPEEPASLAAGSERAEIGGAASATVISAERDFVAHSAIRLDCGSYFGSPFDHLPEVDFHYRLPTGGHSRPATSAAHGDSVPAIVTLVTQHVRLQI